MFDVLTYQKGGSVLRMLEQYLGAERLPRRRPPLPAPPRLRQHRDRRPVGRPRGGERRAGARRSWTRWILQGGHPLVTLRDGTPHPVAVLLRARPPGSAERHRPALAGAGARPGPLGSAAGPSGSCSATSPGRRGPDGGGPVVNAGGWGVYRAGLRRPDLAARPDGCPTSAPLERSNLFADTWALVLAGRADLGGLPRAGRRAGRRGRAEHLLGGGRRPRAVRPGGGRRRPPALAGRHPVAARTAGGRARLGARPTARASGCPRLRALLLAAAGHVGADPGVRPRRARRFDAAAGGGAPIDPDIEAAVLGVGGRPSCGRATTRPSSTATATRPTPRRSCAT